MEAFVKTLRNLQVIILALAAGLIVLSAVMIYMVVQVKPAGFIGAAGPQLGGLPLMSTMLVGISFIILLVSFFIPTLILNAQVTQWARQAKPIEGDLASWETSDLTWLNRVPLDSLSRLLMVFQSSRIVAVALCEGAGMLSGIAYLLEAHLVSLAMVGVAIALMLWHVPTQSMLSSWVFQQMERIKRER